MKHFVKKVVKKEKRAKKSTGKRNLYAILAIIIVIAAASAVFLSVKMNDPREQVLKELKNLPDVSAYANDANYTATVTVLTKDQIQALTKSQPAIYSGLYPGLYQVEYRGQSDGLIVIYDFEEKILLKVFAVQTITI